MKIGERILLSFSKIRSFSPETSLDTALDTLILAFGKKFLSEIKDKVVLDYGCGVGLQAIAMALSGAKFVFGIDIRRDVFEKGKKMLTRFNLEDKVRFDTCIDLKSFSEFFDIIISQNSFEHYSDPEKIVELWHRVLKKRGKTYITFGPPWYAPYGAHMHFFTKIPWVHIIFREKTVMKIRSYFRQDRAQHYEEVEGGLNKITVSKFEDIIKKSGFSVEYLKYIPIKKLHIFAKLPFFREFFINRVDCILTKV